MASCSLSRAGLDAKLARVRALPVHLRSAIFAGASFRNVVFVSAAWVALGANMGEAAAQSDAGQPSGTTNSQTRDVATRAPGSPAFQKTMAPSHLPESVQRRLRERAERNRPLEPLAADPAQALSETARRIGEARMRRVQAFDTGNGVTILSNRLSELPNPTPVAARAPGPISPREGETVVDLPPLTETRSLHATMTSAPMPKNAGFRGWLWPFAALLAVSAGLGTLVYRKTSRK